MDASPLADRLAGAGRAAFVRDALLSRDARVVATRALARCTTCAPACWIARRRLLVVPVVAAASRPPLMVLHTCTGSCSWW